MTRQQIVALLSQETTTPLDFERAWRNLSQLESGEQEQTLRDLVSHARSYYAASAAAALIYERAAGIGDLLAGRILAWSDVERRMALGPALLTGQGTQFHGVSRVLLNHIVEGNVGQMPDPLNSAVDYAAILLSDSQEPQDKVLVQNTVQVFSQSRGLWIALARMNGVGVAELAVAITTYTDQTNPLMIRVAAAVAAAPQNQAAGEFVNDQLSAFLAEYANRSMESLLIDASGGDQQSRDRYKRFSQEQRMISMLSDLSTPAAQQNVSQSLNAQNQAIRMTAALVAIERWPDLVVNMEKGPLTNDEYANLLAHLVARHPSTLESVQSKVPQDQLAAAQGRLQEHGWILLFPFAGPVVAGL